MLKRAFILLVIYFLFAPAAYADAIAEIRNDFLIQHKNECVYLGRSFVASGAGGFVVVKEYPGSNKVEFNIENGEVIYMNNSCLYKGEFWGFSKRYSGWVKIDGQLLVLYDYVAFEEGHLEDFYEYEGDYTEIEEAGAVEAWPWPGADSPLWTIDDLNISSFQVQHAYKDDHGREWGFVPYLYGSPNIWICLSDPLNKDIPAFDPAPQPIPWVSDTAHIDIGESENASPTLIIVLVLVLVIGTVFLIKTFWKPKRKTGGTGND
jgi:hypothetical protein